MADINGFFMRILELYNMMPNNFKVLLNIVIPTVLIAIYAILVWKFYRFLGIRDILGLNLRQYAKEGKRKRMFLSIFFFVEYIVIAPLLVMLWLTVFSIFVLVLSQIETTARVILVSAATVGAIRMTSYYRSDLSKDIAKLIPFTMLAVFLLNPGFFSVDKIIQKISEIPLLLNHIAIYFIFILGLEIVLRFMYGVHEMIFPEKPVELSESDIRKIKKKIKGKR